MKNPQSKIYEHFEPNMRYATPIVMYVILYQIFGNVLWLTVMNER